MKRNWYSLRVLSDLHSPDLIQLSEPMLFQSDILNIMQYFKGEYCAFLNSEDLHLQDLSFQVNKAKGGTMIMWKKALDPYVTVHQPCTSAFLFIVIEIPGVQTSIHGSLYLPTSGKESEYLTELANLKTEVDILHEKFPGAPLFLRGDANSSKSNHNRNFLLTNLCSDLGLRRVSIEHNTYHHFLGEGKSDSELDVLLYSNQSGVLESLLDIICKLENHLVDSHHDALLSLAVFPPCSSPLPSTMNIVAPKVPNARHKIRWSESGAEEYCSLMSYHLPRIRERWLDSSSPSSVSVLLQVTNMVMSEVAKLVNKSQTLSEPISTTSVFIPKAIQRSNSKVVKAAKKLRFQRLNPNTSHQQLSETKKIYKSLKKSHRNLVRLRILEHSIKADTKTHAILSSNPSKFFSFMRNLKRPSDTRVKQLTVRDKIYPENEVGDGLYDSIAYLKREAHADLETSEEYLDGVKLYKNIIKLCKNGHKIQHPSVKKSEEILKSIKPSVNDRFSITGYHYRYAGEAGLLHFHSLLTSVIDDLNSASIDELNEVWACILHKGHGKNRTSERSYRTISTCPFISKGLDTLIHDLYSKVWDKEQASTQLQGKGSSHELASLLVTEVIQYSLNVNLKPMYILFLDAKSAFDLVIREFLVANLYHYGIRDQGLILIDERLRNRKTFCEWDKKLMGPILDLWGLEQGGKNSSDFFKVYNNLQITTANDSELGVVMGEGLVISAIGQADDVALVSNDIFQLQNLLTLSLDFCRRHHVHLSCEKTKLLCYSNSSTRNQAYYDQLVSPVCVDQEKVQFSNEAEHVGVTRSPLGNTAHIFNRFTAHRKAISAISASGLSRHRRANPAALVRVQQVFGIPVLLSGISTLVLKKGEIDLINQKIKKIFQHCLKLPDSTPRSVVAFLGRVLPGTAIVHLKQLTTFGMVTRMPDSPLHRHAVHVLTSLQPSAKSWFFTILKLCIQYGLPHPLDLLQNPPTKLSFKKKVKAHVIDYWEQILRAEVDALDSLLYFKSRYMSLTKPHPIWTACGPNPYEVHKACCVAKMLSGRYLTDWLQRHWTKNKSGRCLLPLCGPLETPGTLEHLLLFCPSLATRRSNLLTLAVKIAAEHHSLSNILNNFLFKPSEPSATIQLLLDCTSIPEVIQTKDNYGPMIMNRLLYLGRTWCYSIHRDRMTQLGFLKFR